MRKREQEEYEMQLFGFHSRAVNATLKSLIQEKIQSRCQKLCESLEKKYIPSGDNVEILRKNEKKLQRAYCLGCRHHLPALENCIAKLMRIPQHVLINDDKIQAYQYTDENFGDMRRKLENLQRQLKKVIIYNTILKEEMETVEQFNKNINEIKKAYDVISNGIKYHNVNNIMMKLIDSYSELESNFEKSNDVHAVRNKRNCLRYTQKSHDINFP